MEGSAGGRVVKEIENGAIATCEVSRTPSFTDSRYGVLASRTLVGETRIASPLRLSSTAAGTRWLSLARISRTVSALTVLGSRRLLVRRILAVIVPSRGAEVSPLAG